MKKIEHSINGDKVYTVDQLIQLLTLIKEKEGTGDLDVSFDAGYNNVDIIILRGD